MIPALLQKGMQLLGESEKNLCFTRSLSTAENPKRVEGQLLQ